MRFAGFLACSRRGAEGAGCGERGAGCGQAAGQHLRLRRPQPCGRIVGRGQGDAGPPVSQMRTLRLRAGPG